MMPPTAEQRWHLNVVGLQAAHDRLYAKQRIMDDLVRLWRGVPTRHQLARIIAADKARERQEAAARRAGML
jgi:hypothetical protein